MDFTLYCFYTASSKLSRMHLAKAGLSLFLLAEEENLRPQALKILPAASVFPAM